MSAGPTRLDRSAPPPSTSRSLRRVPSTSRGWHRYRNRDLYMFVAPWFLGFLCLTVAPLMYALWISFTDSDGINPDPNFIGLANYLEFFHDPAVLHSLYRTGLFVLVVVPTSVIGALVLAVLVNKPVFGRGFFRAVFYLPAIVPPVASGITWRLIFDRDSGAANDLMYRAGGPIIMWLADPAVFYVLISLVLWGIGGGMLVTLAGLQDVPAELLEAAQIDGANKWQRFIHVTIPIISPILLFQVVTGVIGALQTFAQVVLLAPPNAGGAISTAMVPSSNQLFMVHAYSQFFTFSRFGYGSAMLWIFFLIILLLTVIILKASSAVVFYDSDPTAGKGQPR